MYYFVKFLQAEKRSEKMSSIDDLLELDEREKIEKVLKITKDFTLSELETLLVILHMHSSKMTLERREKLSDLFNAG